VYIKSCDHPPCSVVPLRGNNSFNSEYYSAGWSGGSKIQGTESQTLSKNPYICGSGATSVAAVLHLVAAVLLKQFVSQ